MKKRIKSAIVGTGFIGKQHYEAIRRLPNTEIIAVVETNEARAKEFALEYGIPHYYTSYDDLLEQEAVDVVHICTPNALHYPMAKKALEKGIHVFCEKPLSLTASESKELVELAEKSSAHHAVNLNYRSNAMVRDMKERVQSEDFGTLLLVHVSYIQDWLMFDDDYDWHFDPKLVGPSRTVADIGTHAFDLIQFVTGQRIKAVFAKLITVYPERKKRESFGETFAQSYGEDYTLVPVVNEDAAIIIARLESGVHVSLNLSQVTGGYKNGVQLVLSGSKSSLTWNQERADRLIIGNRLKGNEEIYADAKYLSEGAKRFINLPNGHAVGWADAFKNSIHEFYAGLDTEYTGSYVDFKQGHNLMQLVEASLKSSETGTWVELEDA